MSAVEVLEVVGDAWWLVVLVLSAFVMGYCCCLLGAPDGGEGR